MNLDDKYPIIAIDGHVAFLANGNIVCGYELELPEIYSLSEKDYDDIHATWIQAIKSLPVGTVIHKQDVYLKQELNTNEYPSSSFLQRSMKNHFKDRFFMENKSFLYLCYPKNKALQKARFINPFVVPTQLDLDKLEDTAEQFVNACHDTIGVLQSGRKIKATALSAEAFKENTKNYFNGYFEGQLTDVEFKPDFKIGDSHFDMLSINNEQLFNGELNSCIVDQDYTSDDFNFYQGFPDAFGLSLKHNHLVNQIIVIDDHKYWRDQLAKKRMELFKLKRIGGLENKINLDRIDKLIEEVTGDNSSQICRGHFNVLFWAASSDKLTAVRNNLTAHFKSLDILPYRPSGNSLSNLFLNSYFGYSSNLSNEDLYVTDIKHMTCMFLNNGNYKSDDKGVLFCDRLYNRPVFVDIWDESNKRIKARNFAILAPTGEGKSFLANHIITHYYEEDVRLVIIDLGGSYQKFALLYPDDFISIRYQEGENLGINPFYISSETELTAEYIEHLSSFLFELFPKAEERAIVEIVTLKNILVHYYKMIKRNHSMTSFIDFLKANQGNILEDLNISNEEFFDVEAFVLVLNQYKKGDIYGSLFEDKEDQSYKLEDKKIIVFELDEAKNSKEILMVMLKLINTAIQRTIWKNKKERGVILFDEFAKQLKFKGVLEAVEYYFQAIRKQRGAVGIILQSINQLQEGNTAASMIENIQIIFSLFNRNGYDELVRRFSLSTHDHEQLKSIRGITKGDKHTTFFLGIGTERKVLKLEVSPEVAAAYETDGKAHTEIMELHEECGDMETAIKKYVSLRT